jgi:hypothetical protein
MAKVVSKLRGIKVSLEGGEENKGSRVGRHMKGLSKARIWNVLGRKN